MLSDEVLSFESIVAPVWGWVLRAANLPLRPPVRVRNEHGAISAECVAVSSGACLCDFDVWGRRFCFGTGEGLRWKRAEAVREEQVGARGTTRVLARGGVPGRLTSRVQGMSLGMSRGFTAAVTTSLSLFPSGSPSPCKRALPYPQLRLPPLPRNSPARCMHAGWLLIVTGRHINFDPVVLTTDPAPGPARPKTSQRFILRFTAWLVNPGEGRR